MSAPRLKVRQLAVVVLAAATAMAAAGAGSASARAARKSSSSNAPYTVNLGFIASNSKDLTDPWGFAYSRGLLQKWLKAYGITIKVDGFNGGPLLTAAMIGGSVDLGLLGDTPAIVATSHGLQTRWIAQPVIGLSTWILGQPSIKRLSQLAGKSLDRGQAATYVDRYVQGVLSQHGLLSKVHLLTIASTTEGVGAFEKGSIPAIAVSPEIAQTLLAEHKGFNVLAKSEDTPRLEGTQVTVATKKILAAHPDLPKDWNAARIKAVKYANAHPSAYYAWAAQNAGGGVTAASERKYDPLSEFPVPDFTSLGLTQLEGTQKFLESEHEATPFSLLSWKLSN